MLNNKKVQKKYRVQGVEGSRGQENISLLFPLCKGGKGVVHSNPSLLDPLNPFLIFCLCAFFLFASVPFSFAQEDKDDIYIQTDIELLKRLPGLANKVSIDLRGIDASNIFNFIAAKGDVNIVSSGSVGGKTSVMLKDVTIKEALDIVIKANNLAYDISGNTIFIMTAEEYESKFGKKFLDSRQMKIVQLKYASSKDVGAILEAIKTTVGSVIVDHTTGTVILMEHPEKLKLMLEIIDQIERPAVTREFPTITKVFRLQYAEIDDITQVITSALTKEIGVVRSDKKTKTIIVTDIPKNMEGIERIVSSFDEKPLQVLIEAKIMQIRLSDEFNMGVDWETLFKNMANLSFKGTFPASPALSSFQKISVGELEGNNFTAAINFLKTVGETNLLSSPHIIASNNEEAKIHVGTKEAYVTCTVSTGSSTTTTAGSVEFVDVGVKLTVTPTINRKGFVRMKIKPEVSSVTDTLKQDCVFVPIIETSMAETNITVKDGVTVIIGGLIKDTKGFSESKVPILGDIPFLGNLFKSKSQNNIKTELVVFITPRIVSGEEDITKLDEKKKELKPEKAEGFNPVSSEGKEIRGVKRF